MALFGEVAIELGYITQQQLDQAMTRQIQGRAILGQILSQMEVFSGEQSEEVYAYQLSNRGEDKKFGECAVEMNLVSPEKVNEVVQFQETSKGNLGDILIDMGYITREQRDEALRIQQKSPDM